MDGIVADEAVEMSEVVEHDPLIVVRTVGLAQHVVSERRTLRDEHAIFAAGDQKDGQLQPIEVLDIVAGAHTATADIGRKIFEKGNVTLGDEVAHHGVCDGVDALVADHFAEGRVLAIAITVLTVVCGWENEGEERYT